MKQQCGELLKIMNKSILFLGLFMIMGYGCAKNTATAKPATVKSVLKPNTPTLTNTVQSPIVTRTLTPSLIPTKDPIMLRINLGHNYVKVYSCPSKDCEQIDFIREDGKFETFAHNDNFFAKWFQIEYEEEKLGWVAKDGRVEVPEGAWENLPATASYSNIDPNIITNTFERINRGGIQFPYLI